MKTRGKIPPDPDLAAWCAVLAEVTAPVDTVPPGWFTAKQIADSQKCSEVRTRARIGSLLKAGKIEQRVFRVNLGKIVRPCPHYRLK
jgi:response regulator of citrate/malate metabolism